MIEHQLATHPAALACFRWDRVNLFQVLVYMSLYLPARVALALPIDFGDGGAGDFEDSLFSADDTDHPTRFLLGRDDLFLYLNAPLYSTSMQCPSGPRPSPTTKCLMVKNLWLVCDRRSPPVIVRAWQEK